jgi:membrane protein
VYYSAVIVLFGAEVTQVYARLFGSGIRPAEHAEFAECPEPAAR